MDYMNGIAAAPEGQKDTTPAHHHHHHYYAYPYKRENASLSRDSVSVSVSELHGGFHSSPFHPRSTSPPPRASLSFSTEKEESAEEAFRTTVVRRCSSASLPSSYQEPSPEPANHPRGRETSTWSGEATAEGELVLKGNDKHEPALDTTPECPCDDGCSLRNGNTVLSNATLLSRCEHLTMENERLYLLLWEQDLMMLHQEKAEECGKATVDALHNGKSNGTTTTTDPAHHNAGCLVVHKEKGRDLLREIRDVDNIMSTMVEKGDQSFALRLADRRAAWQRQRNDLKQKIEALKDLLTELVETTTHNHKTVAGGDDDGNGGLASRTNTETNSRTPPLCIQAMIQCVSLLCLTFNALACFKEELLQKQ